MKGEIERFLLFLLYLFYNNMKTVEKKIYTGFFLISLIILSLTVVSLISMRLLLNRSSTDKHTLDVLKTVENLNLNSIDIETGVRGYLISGDTTFLRPYYSGADSILQNLKYLEILNKDDHKYDHDLKYLNKYIKDLTNISNRLILAEKTNQTDTLERYQQILSAKKSMDRIRSIIHAIESENRIILKNINIKNRKLAIFTQYGFIITGIFTLFALFSVFLIIKGEFSRRKKVEATLLETQQFLDSLVEFSPNVVYSKDKKGVYTFVNKAFEKLIDKPREEILGKNDIELFENKETALKLMNNDAEVLRLKKPMIYEEQTLSSNKEVRYFLSTKFPILDARSEVKYLCGFSSDITDRVHAELNINKLNAELEAFSYSVSHDLRAPLRAVDGFAKILVEDYASTLDSEGNRLLNIIIQNATKMSKLVDDLLDFSRIGRKELSKINIYFKDLFNEVIAEIEIPENLEIKVNISEKTLINVDRNMLKVVLNNLLSNSIKYSSKVTSPIINVFEVNDEHNFIFCVEDNGVGFDEVFKNKLFEVFQRLHSEAEYEGTGVGLALVNRIVEKHGGKVWAESVPMISTKFYISLPLK